MHGTQSRLHNTNPSNYYNKPINDLYVPQTFEQQSQMQHLMNGYPRILAPSQVNYRNNSFGPQNTTPIKGGRIPPPNNSTINRSGFS